MILKVYLGQDPEFKGSTYHFLSKYLQMSGMQLQMSVLHCFYLNITRDFRENQAHVNSNSPHCPVCVPLQTAAAQLSSEKSTQILIRSHEV